jgi:hypothetical protein
MSATRGALRVSVGPCGWRDPSFTSLSVPNRYLSTETGQVQLRPEHHALLLPAPRPGIPIHPAHRIGTAGYPSPTLRQGQAATKHYDRLVRLAGSPLKVGMEALGVLDPEFLHSEPTETGKDVQPQEPAIAVQRGRPAPALLDMGENQLSQLREAATPCSLSPPLGQRVETPIDQRAQPSGLGPGLLQSPGLAVAANVVALGRLCRERGTRK